MAQRAKNAKRIDAMLAQPMDRFRRTLSRLGEDDLQAVDARIGLQVIRQRWARGSHGPERLRARNELGRLSRRYNVTRREIESRRAPGLAPVTPIGVAADAFAQTSFESEERAA